MTNIITYYSKSIVDRRNNDANSENRIRVPNLEIVAVNAAPNLPFDLHPVMRSSPVVGRQLGLPDFFAYSISERGGNDLLRRTLHMFPLYSNILCEDEESIAKMLRTAKELRKCISIPFKVTFPEFKTEKQAIDYFAGVRTR